MITSETRVKIPPASFSNSDHTPAGTVNPIVFDEELKAQGLAPLQAVFASEGVWVVRLPGDATADDLTKITNAAAVHSGRPFDQPQAATVDVDGAISNDTSDWVDAADCELAVCQAGLFRLRWAGEYRTKLGTAEQYCELRAMVKINGDALTEIGSSTPIAWDRWNHLAGGKAVFCKAGDSLRLVLQIKGPGVSGNPGEVRRSRLQIEHVG